MSSAMPTLRLSVVSGSLVLANGVDSSACHTIRHVRLTPARHRISARSSLCRWVVVRATADVGTASGASETAAPPAASSEFRPGARKGFVEEMRIRAMKLHTRDQAKEGEKPEQERPLAKWEPTKEGYIQFLVDSKLVYDTMEGIMKEAKQPGYSEFVSTGLERSEALAKDLVWFESQGFQIPPADKAGSEYSEYLKELAETDPPAFICHFYNVYFAHTAGGRMIGRKVSEMILDGRELEFYRWDSDLQELLGNVRDKINHVAESWTRDQKDHCLSETEKSFKYSGTILRLLVS